jgi:hypothetical protein
LSPELDSRLRGNDKETTFLQIPTCASIPSLLAGSLKLLNLSCPMDDHRPQALSLSAIRQLRGAVNERVGVNHV